MKRAEVSGSAAKMVLRTLDVLETMSAAEDPLSLTQIARRLDLPKSTVFRMLLALEERRYVVRETASKAYLPGPRLRLAPDHLVSRRSLVASARPMLDALAAETRETAHLAVLDDNRVTYLDVVEPAIRIRAWITPGEVVPGTCVASGKAILAQSSSEVVARVLAGPLPRCTEASEADPDRLRRSLERARRQGYATNQGEWEKDIFGLSAPVLGAADQAVAAVGISGPISRFQPERVKALAEIVRAHAGQLSRLMRPARPPEPAAPRTRRPQHAPS